MQNDPSCLRMNVLTQTFSHSCLICNAVNNLVRLSVETRVDILVQKNVCFKMEHKICAHHSNEKGGLFHIFHDTLRSSNRPAKMNVNELFSEMITLQGTLHRFLMSYTTLTQKIYCVIVLLICAAILNKYHLP